MDNKQSLPDSLTGAVPHTGVSRRTRCYLLPSVLGALAIFYWLSLWTPAWSPCHTVRRNTSTYAAARMSKVPLEAHIMSKCPDAQVCLRDLVVPAMEDVYDKVDFKLSYIGTVNDKDGGVECKHGPDECLGNILELCAADLYPDPKIHLGFAMCLTNDYEQIPEEGLVKDCALEHGVDFDKLNNCASKDDGAYGQDLLRDSVNRTAEAGVTKSCTVRLNGDVRCIRDGGEWKDCDGGSTPKDLVRDVVEAVDRATSRLSHTLN